MKKTHIHAAQPFLWTQERKYLIFLCAYSRSLLCQHVINRQLVGILSLAELSVCSFSLIIKIFIFKDSKALLSILYRITSLQQISTFHLLPVALRIVIKFCLLLFGLNLYFLISTLRFVLHHIHQIWSRRRHGLLFVLPEVTPEKLTFQELFVAL